jgi:hypothetical protein
MTSTPPTHLQPLRRRTGAPVKPAAAACSRAAAGGAVRIADAVAVFLEDPKVAWRKTTRKGATYYLAKGRPPSGPKPAGTPTPRAEHPCDSSPRRETFNRWQRRAASWASRAPCRSGARPGPVVDSHAGGAGQDGLIGLLRVAPPAIANRDTVQGAPMRERHDDPPRVRGVGAGGRHAGDGESAHRGVRLTRGGRGEVDVQLYWGNTWRRVAASSLNATYEMPVDVDRSRPWRAVSWCRTVGDEIAVDRAPKTILVYRELTVNGIKIFRVWR